MNPLPHVPRPSTLVVLTGGGAVGVVKHVAMLHALSRQGIVPTALSGTSAGGLIALLVASGVSATHIMGELLRLQTDDLKDKHFAWMARFRFLESIHKGDAVGRIIDRLIPATWEELRLPVAVWGIDEQTGDLLNLRDVAPDPRTAARATMAAPPLLPAVRIGARRVIDGGIGFNVPLLHGWLDFSQTVLCVATPPLANYRRYDVLSRGVHAIRLMMHRQVQAVLEDPLVRSNRHTGRLKVLWPDVADEDGGLLDLDLTLWEPAYLAAREQLAAQLEGSSWRV